MKRNRSIEFALKMHMWDPPYFIPKNIIPPRSVIRLIQPLPDSEIDMKVGDEFRIGYYSRQDGPNVVWLVRPSGEYFCTWDQASLFETFELISSSRETEIYGANRPILEPLA
jgi:hypothetical protein